MAEDIKFIEFTEVPGAPKLAVPADFTQTQIDDYLKSEKVENAMFEKGFRFKYGMTKKELESYGRTIGIEIDRRHNKKKIIKTLQSSC